MTTSIRAHLAHSVAGLVRLRTRASPLVLNRRPGRGRKTAAQLVKVSELFAGWPLWQGERLGALITIALLPIEVVFWAGFAVPIPPLIAVVRIGLLAAGWSSLR